MTPPFEWIAPPARDHTGPSVLTHAAIRKQSSPFCAKSVLCTHAEFCTDGAACLKWINKKSLMMVGFGPPTG